MGDACRTPTGNYSVAKARKWIAENIRTDQAPYSRSGDVADSDLRVELQRAELEKTREQGRKERLKNDMLEGRLVDREEVELRAGEMGARIRQRLESVPDEMQMIFPPELRQELTGEVRRHIENVLKEMSTWQFINEDKA